MCKLTAPFVYFTAASLCIQKFDLQTHWRGFWVSFNTSCTMGARQNNHCYVYPFCLTVLQGRDMQAFVTHEHALRKKARCIFIFAMAALGLASFALIHLGDGFFVKAGVLVAVVASICILQFSMFPWCIQINYQHLPNGIAATPSHPLATSRYIFACHNSSFRFPEAGPASHVFDLSWCYHMCRCLGRATKVWPRVAGLAQQMLACPGRRVNQAKQLSHKDEASD